MPWHSTDSRQTMTAVDAELYARLASTSRALHHLVLAFPALTNLLRDHQATGVRAAASGEGGGPSPWCWRHGRTIAECEKDDHVCSGEIVAGPSDPTGDAALDGDKAAADARELRKTLERIARYVEQSVRIASQYPALATTPLGVMAEPGDDWCRCCWKDNHYTEPVATHPGGRTMYRGLCRWCGDFKGSHGIEPPTALVAARHRGEWVTQGMVDRELKKARRKAS